MSKKRIALCLIVVLLVLGILTAGSEEKYPKRKVSEKLCNIDLFSLIPNSLIISPDLRRVSYAAKSENKIVVVLDGKKGKRYDDITLPIFSPDSKRLSYTAKLGNKWVVIVDGKEEKQQYDGIGTGTLIFSPDSKRLAYAAQLGNKWVVVVDKNEGKKYDAIIPCEYKTFIFDTINSFHYITIQDDSFYFVEETIE